MDDIPGRIIGEKIGIDAFNLGISLFKDQDTSNDVIESAVYPNPLSGSSVITITNTKIEDTFQLTTLAGTLIKIDNQEFNPNNRTTNIPIKNLPSGVYILQKNSSDTFKLIIY